MGQVQGHEVARFVLNWSIGACSFWARTTRNSLTLYPSTGTYLSYRPSPIVVERYSNCGYLVHEPKVLIMNISRVIQRFALVLSLAFVSISALAVQQAYKLRVDGLACPFCAYGIEKKLTALKGVQRTEVDIASGTVIVTMAEGASLDEAAATKAVKDAGFTLRAFEQAQAGLSKN